MICVRLLAALLAVLLFPSCQTASTLVQEPFNLLNSMATSVGRIFHSSNDRSDGDASIEAAEAKQAQDQLAQENAAKPTAAPVTSEVASR